MKGKFFKLMGIGKTVIFLGLGYPSRSFEPYKKGIHELKLNIYKTDLHVLRVRTLFEVCVKVHDDILCTVTCILKQSDKSQNKNMPVGIYLTIRSWYALNIQLKI
jgi:hypothetical protein